MADREETIILDVDVDVEDSVESINDLTAANKELRKERNALNLQSEQGKKRAQEINALIDQNTSKIKENVSAIEKQKINIGNYKSALDGVHPALGKVGEGLESGAAGLKAMTLQALRFIATPIGAILAALVAIFTVLKAAISSNNEVLDKFENITNAIGVILDVVVARVGKLGEALIALVSGDFDKAADLTAAAFSGLAEEIANAVTQGQLYLDLSRELEDSQRALRIETARTENEIKRLVVASKNRNLSLDEQEEMLRKALALEEELVDKRAENAQKDLVLTAKRLALERSLSQTAEETFDQFLDRLVTGGKLADEGVDEIVDKIEALEQARGSSLAFQEKLENNLATIQEKRTKILEDQAKALAEQEAQLRATQRAANQIEPTTEDPLVGAFQTQATIITDINDRMNTDLAKRNEAFRAEEAKRVEAGAQMAVLVERQKVDAISNLTGALADVLHEDTAGYKILASAEALMNTYLAATAAYASGAKINPVFGAISAAAAVVAGLANVARINSIEFAEGGYTGDGAKMQPAGIVHAGEVVWSQKDVAKVGGPLAANAMRPTFRGYQDGGVVTSSLTAPITAQLEMANIIKNMPSPVVEVVEINKVQRAVAVKQKISRR
jgi:hypothetical protein